MDRKCAYKINKYKKQVKIAELIGMVGSESTNVIGIKPTSI